MTETSGATPDIPAPPPPADGTEPVPEHDSVAPAFEDEPYPDEPNPHPSGPR